MNIVLCTADHSSLDQNSCVHFPVHTAHCAISRYSVWELCSSAVQDPAAYLAAEYVGLVPTPIPPIPADHSTNLIKQILDTKKSLIFNLFPAAEQPAAPRRLTSTCGKIENYERQRCSKTFSGSFISMRKIGLKLKSHKSN